MDTMYGNGLGAPCVPCVGITMKWVTNSRTHGPRCFSCSDSNCFFSVKAFHDKNHLNATQQMLVTNTNVNCDLRWRNNVSSESYFEIIKHIFSTRLTLISLPMWHFDFNWLCFCQLSCGCECQFNWIRWTWTFLKIPAKKNAINDSSKEWTWTSTDFHTKHIPEKLENWSVFFTIEFL